MRITLPAILLAALAAAPLAVAASAGAAMLRPLTTLSSGVVHLSDLFDDAGRHADLALGPAPPPGQSIVVEAPQLAAIAREFGVAWRPMSDGDRAILQRPGTTLRLSVVLAALRQALDDAGAPPGELDLPGFAGPLVAPESHVQVGVEQVSFDPPSGRFTAAIAITGADMEALHLPVSGVLQAMETVLVAARPLPAGELIGPDDLRPSRVRSLSLHGDVVRSAADVVGLAPRRALAAGEPVLLDGLERPAVVQRGAPVTITLETGGLSLSSIGQALESGAIGARVTVLNPVSRAVLLAEVTGPGAVRLDPGTMPLRPGSDTARNGFGNGGPGGNGGFGNGGFGNGGFGNGGSP